MARETERKYLIEYPDTELLMTASERIVKITQTYLKGECGEDRRVRMAVSNGRTVYTYTVKTRISRLSRNEDEREICEGEYKALLLTRDPDFAPLEKTRYCVKTESGHTAEIDVYVNITEYAICEVELSDENESHILPKEIKLIREVTGEKKYTNRAIAKII